jgi:phosphoglycerate dehydrogenase-like enzyme
VIDYLPDAIGVFHDFPHSNYRKIINFPNVTITPEIGFYTKESMLRNNREVFDILKGLEL